MEIGLALSGGGTRGIAHAGVIKALEENNIKPKYIAGTSAGSIVAGLYAIGYSADNIYTLFRRYAKTLIELDKNIVRQEIKNHILKRKIKNNGLKSNENLGELCNNLAFSKGIKKMSDVKMPLIIPTVDISSSTKYILSSVDIKNECCITDITLGEAIRASSSFPVIFQPFKYKNHLFLDGGLLENIPAQEIKKIGAEKVISVRFDSNKIEEDSNMMDIAIKAIDVMGDKISEKSLNSSDYIITVPTDGAGLLDIEKMEYCFQSGYETTKEEINKIKDVLIRGED